jgi:hypothetical protein
MKLVISSIVSIILLSCMPVEETPTPTPTPIPVTPPDPYAGCCGTESVEFRLDNNFIFIPNLFTPNGDGLNDLFRPFYNTSKVKLNSITIKANNTNATTLWQQENPNPNAILWGWLGKVKQDSTYQGRFNYTMVFSTIGTGQTQTITGSACSAICRGTAQIPIKTKNQCFFPMQYASDSIIRTSPISFEIKCLQ